MRGSVYRLFDANGRLLYVGMTSRAGRWFEHLSREWWPDVATATVEHFPTREDASLAEANAIRNENPRHNGIRYDGRSHHYGRIYREWHEGTVFFRKDQERWIASIRWNGKRTVFYGGKGERGKAQAERRLREFRETYVLPELEAA
jgi:hypothetical protein